MNFINLLSILESKNNLPNELFEKYLEYQNVDLKDDEIRDLLKLIEKLVGEYQNSNIFDGYYTGYQIPQISKEFDLLKITKSSVINIELKSGASNESIKEQLIQNKYYLSSLGKGKIYNITYQSNEDKLYILDEKNEQCDLEVKDLVGILASEPPLKVNLNSLFDPSKFLVSPFNNTDRFIKDEYFLTNHQKRIKDSIIKIIEKNTYDPCAISGKAGTGKTLLVYDIAKEMILNKYKVLIVHCGKLNEGHEKLRDVHKIDLIPIKYFTEKKVCENYNLIIFDEAQRIRSGQTNTLLKNKNKSNLLFSYDKSQTLSREDGEYLNGRTASELYKKIKNHFQLSENIRTNKEISSFIKRFVNKKNNISQREYKNITIQNFENMNCVGDYVRNLEDDGWVYISYTNKLHGNTAVYQTYNVNYESLRNAHDVIGQEFDKVVVIVGEKFLYKETGELTHHMDGPYMPHKMLFQAMTRVRKELKIIIVNNPDILERCIEILSPHKRLLQSQELRSQEK
jgi:hypothetical protein